MSNNYFDFPVSKRILLTGAGFTHNYGGFLAKRMWSEIHNRYLKLAKKLEAEKLKARIKSTFNYEDLYEEVLQSKEFKNDEKSFFFKAVLEAYYALDDVIREFREENLQKRILNLQELRDFFEQLAGGQKERGFFFTLNQDLFVERYCYGGGIGPTLPGVKVDNKRFSGRESVSLDEIGYVKISRKGNYDYQDTIELKNQSKLFYVKLHGSCDWRDEQKQEILILGTNKPSRISSTPLLAWYFDLFKKVLSNPNSKLMVIGYGFQDKHINEAIASAAKNSNLRIFILNPQDPDFFLHNILKVNQWENDSIWGAVEGYYQITPKELFSGKTNLNSQRANLMENFFD